ncbi:MAG TPA: hypothetical protein VL422_18810 [Miltoncostaea sp.]|nr:hypothetical protein [Miltoncostaea sp.]
MRRRRAGRRGTGQAAIEVLALIPLLVVVALIGWQLAAVVTATLRADARAREDALRATGGGRVVVIEGSARVPAFLPGVRGLRVPARVGVRTP